MRFVWMTLLLILTGCTTVQYNGHKPKHVWYWSKEAEVQRRIKIETESFEQTNKTILTNLLEGIGSTNATPRK